MCNDVRVVMSCDDATYLGMELTANNNLSHSFDNYPYPTITSSRRLQGCHSSLGLELLDSLRLQEQYHVHFAARATKNPEL